MNKWLIIYSSNTGNTEKIAKAMYEALDENEGDIFSVREIPKDFDFSKYDIIAVGYWLTRGAPDNGIKETLKRIENKQVILFQTHGAMRYSEHVITAFARAALCLGKGCDVLGTFSCQGKINPALLARRKDNDPKDPHSASPKNMKRWEEASKHPNEDDIKEAKEFIGYMKHKLDLKNKYMNYKY